MYYADFISFKLFVLYTAYAVNSLPEAIQVDNVGYSFDSDSNNDDIEALGKHSDIFGYHPATYDTAYLYINNTLNERIYVRGQSDECYKVGHLVADLIPGMSGRLETIHKIKI